MSEAMHARAQNRRTFLRGAGGLGLALPFLPSLLPRAAFAGPTPVRRFVFIRSDHGGLSNENWCPPESTLTERASLSPTHEMRWGRLQRTVNGDRAQVSPMLSGPAAVLTDRLVGKMSFLRGLDITFNNGHNHGSVLGTYTDETGAPLAGMAQPTIDQVMAASPSFYASLGGIRAKSVFAGDPGLALSFRYRSASDPAAGIERTSWNDYPLGKLPKLLFADNEPAPVAMGVDRKLLVDGVVEDYRRLRNGSRRLSMSDRQRLDDHLDRLAEIQRRSTTLTTRTCSKPTVDARVWYTSPEGRVLMNDIIAAAFACDTTRIFAMGVSAANYDPGHPNWHGVAHEADKNPNDQQVLTAGNGKLFEGAVLDLARKLDEIPEEGGGTILDSTLIVWVQESAYPSHEMLDLRAVTFGSAGGALKTGVYCDYRNRVAPCALRGSYLGVPYTRFMAHTLLAMGVPRTEWETPGARGYGRMLYDNKQNGWSGNARYQAGTMEALSDPLPVVT